MAPVSGLNALNLLRPARVLMTKAALEAVRASAGKVAKKPAAASKKPVAAKKPAAASEGSAAAVPAKAKPKAPRRPAKDKE